MQIIFLPYANYMLILSLLQFIAIKPLNLLSVSYPIFLAFMPLFTDTKSQPLITHAILPHPPPI
jgi:hypothetical protein